MRSVLNNMETSVQIRDLDGRFTFVNQTFLDHAECTEDEVIGRTLREAFDDDVAALAEEIDASAFKGPDSLIPREVTFPSGKTFLVNSFLLAGENGRRDGVCTTGVEITRLKTAERELRDARRLADDANLAKSRFLASMSHEFRTPMNAIIGYSEMLVEEAEQDGNETYLGDLRRILSASHHLLDLINGVLDLSKIEAGRMDLYVGEFSLAKLLDDVVANVAPLVEKNGNRLAIDDGEIVAPLRNDVTRLRQIVLNLLSNAAKFTTRGDIDLRCAIERSDGNDWLTISVADTGIGMTAEQMERLFLEFSQAKTAHSAAGEGTGLGLIISRSLARLMGGEIAVDSTPGEGSRFTLRVPARIGDGDSPAAVAAPTALEVPADTASPARTHARTVLVIDDDASARELIARYLVREGLRVLTAASGAEGIAKARESKPDAITLDVLMDGMDGWEVLRRLAEDTELRDIPTVVCTVLDARHEAFSLGAVECLVKPIDRGALVQSIQRFTKSEGAAPTALVVDDDEASRRLFERHLADSGFTVALAEDGMAAMDLLDGGLSVDLVILDLLMPRMDGFQFLRAFRRSAKWETVPVIIVTAKSLRREEADELRRRAQSVFTKDGTSIDEVLAFVTKQILIYSGRPAAVTTE